LGFIHAQLPKKRKEGKGKKSRKPKTEKVNPLSQTSENKLRAKIGNRRGGRQ